MGKSKKTTSQKLTSSIVLIIILSLCLFITTFALVYSVIRVDDNLFETGIVKINLNDGKAVIEEHEFLFEPGMTVEKDFFLKNESSCDVYYKLYFKNVEGGLADVLDILIKDKEQVLFSGKMNELTREKVGAADDMLKLNQKKDLKIVFHFPEEAGNEAQSLYLSFDIGADAVQTKNNPSRLFD